MEEGRRRSADRISLTSFPFFFEGADVKIADGFTTPVQDAELSRKLLSGSPHRAESDHPRDIVKITFVCELRGSTN